LNARSHASIGDRLERAIEEHADTAHELKRGEAEQPTRASLRRTVFWLTVTAVSLYLVAPGLLDVLGSWRDLQQITPIWFAAIALLQTGSLGCLWVLQRLALGQVPWRAVITSQLAGNALAKVAPAGGAVGAALQYRMLVQGGARRGRAVAALTAANLLAFAVVLALPVLAIPVILRGAVHRTLIEATVLGLAVFGLLFAAGAVLIATDGPLRRIGALVRRIRNRLRRGSEPLHHLPERLLRERDRITATLGSRWKPALLAAIGRWALDYATLLAALAAVGAQPRPILVLLAFCAGQVLTQVPITPGGLGFVEAGLTAMLALAGVATGDAVLATFVYRLFSYWLPMPAGLLGAVLHRRHYPRRTAPALSR
jgi:uncharacterized protein (TIRG00374 family)